jgi:hypothetical protein
MKPQDDEQAVKFSAEPTKAKVKELLDDIEKEGLYSHPGLRCPKCGGMLRHERLSGYRCIRGCQ